MVCYADLRRLMEDLNFHIKWIPSHPISSRLRTKWKALIANYSINWVTGSLHMMWWNYSPQIRSPSLIHEPARSHVPVSVDLHIINRIWYYMINMFYIVQPRILIQNTYAVQKVGYVTQILLHLFVQLVIHSLTLVFNPFFPSGS